LGWNFWPKQKKQHRQAAMSVTVQAVKQETIPLSLTLSGTVVPAKTVSIKSQVTGTIKEVYFHSGNIVKKGQLLFEIDPASFISALKQAQANLLQDSSQLKSLHSDLQRYQILLKKAYISTQQYEQAQANYNAQVAKISADKQAIEQAKISLSYTKIHTPIFGKTGNNTVKKGDLVAINSDVPLVVINEVNPAEIDFYLPQSELKKVYRYQHQQPLTVTVWNEKVTRQLADGKLVFINNQIDNTTGSILLKADVDNSKHQLWPGQFVTVKLILTQQQNALVIPANAIHSDQQGEFVFVVKDKHAQLTRIKVQRQQGNIAVIASGLQVGEEVVVIAPPNLTDKMPVTIEG
jgi:multidrug efflux system membrane fusion protein